MNSFTFSKDFHHWRRAPILKNTSLVLLISVHMNYCKQKMVTKNRFRLGQHKEPSWKLPSFIVQYMIQKVYSMMHPPPCANTDHGIAKFKVYDMVRKTKNWIRKNRSILFCYIKSSTCASEELTLISLSFVMGVTRNVFRPWQTSKLGLFSRKDNDWYFCKKIQTPSCMFDRVMNMFLITFKIII